MMAFTTTRPGETFKDLLRGLWLYVVGVCMPSASLSRWWSFLAATSPHIVVKKYQSQVD